MRSTFEIADLIMVLDPLYYIVTITLYYLYFIDHVIFTSNDRFFKNINNPIIFIKMINEV